MVQHMKTKSLLYIQANARLILQQSRVWTPKWTNQRIGQRLKTVEASH